MIYTVMTLHNFVDVSYTYIISLTSILCPIRLFQGMLGHSKERITLLKRESRFWIALRLAWFIHGMLVFILTVTPGMQICMICISGSLHYWGIIESNSNNSNAWSKSAWLYLRMVLLTVFCLVHLNISLDTELYILMCIWEVWNSGACVDSNSWWYKYDTN